MKTKIIFFSATVFCLGFFLVTTNSAKALSCYGGTGTCKISCDSTKENTVVDTCNTDAPICCVPKAQAGTCAANQGATCVNTSTDCASPKTPITGTFTDCPSPKICCKDPGSGGGGTFTNPITANDAQGLLTSILTALQGIVAIIAIIMIIVGGIMYMFAGVDEKMVETAKKTIAGAVIGLAIVVAAPAFLKEILGILGGSDTSGLLSNAPSLKDIAEKVLNLLLSIVGILAIIGLIIGGGFYLTAYGDEDRIKKGKDIITASIFGIVIASAALIIVRQIAAIFGNNS